MTDSFKRMDILDELDNFNTAPQANSLMEGILMEDESNARLNQREQEPEEEPIEEAKTELPNDYLPLNSSIQDLRGQVDQRLSNIERNISQKLDNLSYQQRQQPQQQTYVDPNYDADAPLTAAQMAPMNQRLEAANTMAARAYVRAEVSRAHLEYERFKQSNPNFELNPQEIDGAIGTMVQNGKLGELENINWRGHFDQLYRPKLDGKLQEYEKTVSDLRKEIDSLKKRPSTSVTTPVSPAVGRSTARTSAIESPLDTIDDNVLNLKSFRTKGNFRTFGNDMKKMLKVNK